MNKPFAALLLPLSVALGCQLAYPFDRNLIEADAVDAGLTPSVGAGDGAAPIVVDASSVDEASSDARIDADHGDASEASVPDAAAEADDASPDGGPDAAPQGDAAPEAD